MTQEGHAEATPHSCATKRLPAESNRLKIDGRLKKIVNMDAEVKEYVEKQKSPHKEICKKLHTIITKTFPGIEDEMKWGVPVFDNGKYYIVALKDHVNLGFSKKGLTKEQVKLFDGHANTTVHLEIKTLKDIDEKRIVKLLKIIKE